MLKCCYKEALRATKLRMFTKHGNRPGDLSYALKVLDPIERIEIVFCGWRTRRKSLVTMYIRRRYECMYIQICFAFHSRDLKAVER